MRDGRLNRLAGWAWVDCTPADTNAAGEGGAVCVRVEEDFACIEPRGASYCEYSFAPAFEYQVTRVAPGSDKKWGVAFHRRNPSASPMRGYMAVKWQQWIPFHIDRFMASLTVQAMHPAARWGYWCLITRQWQSEDCTISADPLELAESSGLGDELWEAHGSRILRKFQPLEDGRLRNQVCFEEWLEAKRVYDKRRESADRTNQLRPQSNVDSSDGYRGKARQAVSNLIRAGKLPRADDVPCADCGHIGASQKHDWDHHLGYQPEHYTDVESVCRICHVKREESRGKRWIGGDRNGDRIDQASGPLRRAYTQTGQDSTRQDITRQGQGHSHGNGNRKGEFSSLESILKNVTLPSPPLPETKADMIAAGWEFSNLRECSICGEELEWWTSRAGKQAPVLAATGELHLGTCAASVKKTN